LEHTWLEVPCAPHRQRRAQVVWEAQLRGFRFPPYRGQRVQVGKDRPCVPGRDLGVRGEREGWIQPLAVIALSVVQGAPEIGKRPASDTGLRVRRQVRPRDGAKRGGNAAAARI